METECRSPLELNPELEALRAKILEENSPQSNDWILNLIERTTHIHAGFLFEDLKTLQNLCLFIGESQGKITDPGWQTLGYHLGLSPSVLKVINHNNFNKEDPCYNTLLAYIQHDNASIGKILEALYSIGRIDVLSRIQNSINELADIILQNHGNNNDCSEDTSDYESLTNSEGQNDRSGDFRTSLIKPRIIPPAPFIFQNIKAVPEFTRLQIQQPPREISFTNEKCEYRNVIQKAPEQFSINFERKCLVESVQNESYENYRENLAPRKKKYGLKILLTFAEDGKKYAEEVCRMFRKKRDNYPSIGVLVLSEHSARVNKDPLQFISGAFVQVDYVCPILTEGYFSLISKKQKISVMSNMYLDSVYVPYIYRLMNSYFVSNDCLNDKVRCIIPDNEFSLIPLNCLWTNPIFGAWVKLSEVDELALRLLKSEC